MKKNNQSYKESLKATSLFGGVQLFNILIQLIKSKIIAILIGPTGMGIYGLFSQTDALIKSCTSFGLSSSAVKNISEANGTGDNNTVLTTTSIFRKLVWITGTLGALVCLIGAQWWSKFTFGSYQYTISFVILSCSMLFQQLTQGQTAILQGLRKYNYMAKANVFGNLIALFVSLPLYYYWRIDAIVPVMVMSSLVALLISWLFYRKLKLKPVKVNRPILINESKNMLLMGVSISFSGILSTIIAYYLRVFIGSEGGLSEVGLFTAGFSIVETYVGLIMTSMGTDYYPRLSSVNKDALKFNETINSQLEIALLLIAPIIAAFIVLIDLLIIVLYSKDFVPAEGMMLWAIYGCFFKVVSWCVAFGILAKGDYKMFLANEILTNAYSLPLKIFGYKFLGLTGVGIAYLICYVLYSMQVCLICKYRYKINISKSSLLIFFSHFPVLTLCLLFSLLFTGWVRYAIGIPLILVSAIVSYRALQTRIDIVSMIKTKIKK